MKEESWLDHFYNFETPEHGEDEDKSRAQFLIWLLSNKEHKIQKFLNAEGKILFKEILNAQIDALRGVVPDLSKICDRCWEMVSAAKTNKDWDLFDGMFVLGWASADDKWAPAFAASEVRYICRGHFSRQYMLNKIDKLLRRS